MELQNVTVVGAGTMGNGIAQVFAINGYPVLLVDAEQGALDRAVATIGKSLERMVRKEKISDSDRTVALDRIQTTSS